MEKDLSIPRANKEPLFGFSDTSGHTLLKDAQDKSRQNTDAHRQSLKLWQLNAEVLIMVQKL